MLEINKLLLLHLVDFSILLYLQISPCSHYAFNLQYFRHKDYLPFCLVAKDDS